MAVKLRSNGALEVHLIFSHFSSSSSSLGDLSSSEEEMIDAGCDPEVGSCVVRYMFKEFLVSLGLFCHET